MVVICITFNLIITIWSLVEFPGSNSLAKKYRWHRLKNMDSTLYLIFYFTSIIINLGLCGFFLIPTILLLSVHMRNFCKNMTTNERYSRKALASQS